MYVSLIYYLISPSYAAVCVPTSNINDNAFKTPYLTDVIIIIDVYGLWSVHFWRLHGYMSENLGILDSIFVYICIRSPKDIPKEKKLECLSGCLNPPFVCVRFASVITIIIMRMPENHMCVC